MPKVTIDGCLNCIPNRFELVILTANYTRRNVAKIPENGKYIAKYMTVLDMIADQDFNAEDERDYYLNDNRIQSNNDFLFVGDDDLSDIVNDVSDYYDPSLAIQSLEEIAGNAIFSESIDDDDDLDELGGEFEDIEIPSDEGE